MYKHRTVESSVMEYAEQSLTDKALESLMTARMRRVEQFGSILGKAHVAETFDRFFISNELIVDEWGAANGEERHRRLRQFDAALRHRARDLELQAEAEARLMSRDAVNDDGTVARAAPDEKDKDDDDSVISVEGFSISGHRPKTRAECPDYRPCPYVSCRYHLYLDVTRRGRLRMNFPKTAVQDLEISCALDLAQAGPKTLEQIGHIMGGISRERVRQIEQAALNALRASGGEILVDFLSDGSSDEFEKARPPHSAGSKKSNKR